MLRSFHVFALRHRNPIALRTPNSPGRHDLLFRVAFGSIDTNAEAARHFRVSPMTIWRWRHDKAPLPERVLNELERLIQKRVAESHQAQTDLRNYRLEPRPEPPLSGFCADRNRRVVKPRY
jgi:hypothetical protein